MSKSTNTTTKSSTYYRDFHKAKRAGRQAAFIKEMYSNDFSVSEIQKVFRKLPLVQIIAIVRS